MLPGVVQKENGHGLTRVRGQQGHCELGRSGNAMGEIKKSSNDLFVYNIMIEI